MKTFLLIITLFLTCLTLNAQGKNFFDKDKPDVSKDLKKLPKSPTLPKRKPPHKPIRS